MPAERLWDGPNHQPEEPTQDDGMPPTWQLVVAAMVIGGAVGGFVVLLVFGAWVAWGA